MIGNPAFPPCRHRLHPADVDEEGDKLPAALGETPRPRQDPGITGEELRIVNADHPGARAGGSDDMVVALECVEHLQGDRLRIGAVARIIGRLTATGLSARHLDGAARLLEQLDGGETDRRPEKIHQAGHEQSYTHRRSAMLCGS